MSVVFTDVLDAHRAGSPVGVASICSAHPLVLEATLAEAASGRGPVLVEATSNQVDQTGGYTGMRPADFRARVLALADAAGVSRSRVILGGDHLGPNRWRSLPAEAALGQAEELVAAYAAAGYEKLHLDCSMACADDPAPLTDAVVSRRAARLARIAEATAPDPAALSYVIGTEVPVPGGAAEAIAELRPTGADAARTTLGAHREAFEAAGLRDVWPRVRALVVQPGVEFDAWQVVDYVPARTEELQRVLDGEPGMVFEAHSTDYQRPAALAALVHDHWAVLKVGPGLTFALREALFALAAIARELVPDEVAPELPDVLESRMLTEPDHWRAHHPGTEAEQRLARRFSFSDRARYYWPDPAVEDAQRRLLAALDRTVIPLGLLSQHLPAQYARVRAGELAPRARALVVDHVAEVLRAYHDACGG